MKRQPSPMPFLHQSNDDLTESHLSSSGADEVDAQERAKHVDLTRLWKKVGELEEQLKREEDENRQNLNEYLKLTLDNQSPGESQRAKRAFEKKTGKYQQTSSRLRQKLEETRKHIDVLEHSRTSLHSSGKSLRTHVLKGFKDVGAKISGGVVDNFRGAKDTFVSKPKEFAHLLKSRNKSGSADNINSLKLDNDVQVQSVHAGSTTLPSDILRYQPTEKDNDVCSDPSSEPSGSRSSPRPNRIAGHTAPHTSSGSQGAVVDLPSSAHLSDGDAHIDYITSENQGLTYSTELLECVLAKRLNDGMEACEQKMSQEVSTFRQALEEERFIRERLEAQLNDVSELHQAEVSNLSQELRSMEEKLHYQLDERTRDMQELLDTCQTRINKMELQQQQQHLISMEGIDNTNFRALLTKLINVVLALLAVILVFVSTLANLTGPFLTTRIRILSTACFVAFIVAVWQNWNTVYSFGQTNIPDFFKLFPVR